MTEKISEPIPDRPNNYKELLAQIMATIDSYPMLGKILFMKLKTKYGIYNP